MNAHSDQREPQITLWKCPECPTPSRFGPHYCGKHAKHAEPVVYVPRSEKKPPGPVIWGFDPK